jgi:nicotinamide mononucleotide transporter
MNIFDINFIVLTILDYELSLLELIGTVSGLACVYLTAKEKVLCWPVGIVNIIFFFFLFYQSQFYSDMYLQIYFLVMSIYGWWMWTHPVKNNKDKKNELKVTDLSKKNLIIILSLSAATIIINGFLMTKIHIVLPEYFPEPAAYPFGDAFTSVLSIVATVLLARKKRETWLMWIAVDSVAIVLYFRRGIILTAILYIIFGIIATFGYINWTKIMKGYNRKFEKSPV